MQGFRIESRKFPRLHEVGGEGKFLSQEAVHMLVHYAAQRGIRVVPELDVPGHVTAMLYAYPEYADARYVTS